MESPASGRRLPHVVIDTTALRADLRLSGVAWEQTLAFSERKVIALHISDVTLQESIRHFTREIDKSTRSIRNGLGPLRRLGVDMDLAYQEQIEQKIRAVAESYEAFLRARLRNAGANILALPGISHKELLARDLDGRKPFNANGKGYRDALIWASVIELCTNLGENDTLILVTDNSTDFCGADGAIAREMIDELPTGITAIRYSDLKTMLTEQDWPTELGHVQPTLDREILKDAVVGACDALAGNEVEAYGSGEWSSGLDFNDLPLPEGLDSITVENVDPDLDTITWEPYDKLDDGTVLAEVHVDASVTLDGFMPHGDYYANEDAVELHDVDWNEHYAWVYVERGIRLGFSAVIDPDLTSIAEIEFNSTSSID
jgi:hypothetical protein